ncbi:MAG: hypothetical protein GXP49_15675 [Deltaproteobacteria bacterium]|nr:hypothetical protein [Deltaproteobacteria bacterium]
MTVIGSEDTGDCDGDGETDPGYGLFCGGEPNWWDDLGWAVCDQGELVCSSGSKDAEALLDARLPVRSFSLKVVGDRAYLGTAWGVLCLDVSEPSSPGFEFFVPFGRVNDVETNFNEPNQKSLSPPVTVPTSLGDRTPALCTPSLAKAITTPTTWFR